MATIINDVNDLQDMDLDLAGDYELGNDIDASATVGWNGGEGFEPIGPFTGSLDGKDFSITDLHINRPTTNRVGLFGETGVATISDVHLVGVSITGQDDVGGLVGGSFGCTISGCSVIGNITAVRYAGGLIGYAYPAVISDCHTNCNVEATGIGFDGRVAGMVGWFRSGSATTSSALGTATGYGRYAGGFTGYLTSTGTITQCWANIVVNGNYAVGGFVGWAGGLIQDCYARGAVTGTDRYIGGFAGVSDDMERCHSTGLVSGPLYVGGLIGNEGGTTTDCFWDTETSGQATSYGGTGKTTAQMKQIATFAAWDMIQSATDLASGYPYLSWQLGSSHVWYIFGAIPIVPPSPRTTVDVEDIVTLQAIRNIEMAARGRFYTDEEGNAVYKSRYGRNP